MDTKNMKKFVFSLITVLIIVVAAIFFFRKENKELNQKDLESFLSTHYYKLDSKNESSLNINSDLKKYLSNDNRPDFSGYKLSKCEILDSWEKDDTKLILINSQVSNSDGSSSSGGLSRVLLKSTGGNWQVEKIVSDDDIEGQHYSSDISDKNKLKLLEERISNSPAANKDNDLATNEAMTEIIKSEYTLEFYRAMGMFEKLESDQDNQNLVTILEKNKYQ